MRVAILSTGLTEWHGLHLALERQFPWQAIAGFGWGIALSRPSRAPIPRRPAGRSRRPPGPAPCNRHARPRPGPCHEPPPRPTSPCPPQPVGAQRGRLEARHSLPSSSVISSMTEKVLQGCCWSEKWWKTQYLCAARKVFCAARKAPCALPARFFALPARRVALPAGGLALPAAVCCAARKVLCAARKVCCAFCSRALRCPQDSLRCPQKGRLPVSTNGK